MSTNLKQIFLGKPIKAIVADVRGTLVDPVIDEPISGDLCTVINGLIAADKIVALNTATSIQSLTQLVIAPLSREQDLILKHQDSFIMYVDSSTRAYKLDNAGNPRALDNFEFLLFEDSELKLVLDIVQSAADKFSLDSSTPKVKAGQVNFYCGGSWEQRVSIATLIESHIRESGNFRIDVMVPSAKETIDIAVCQKDRGILDFINRYSLRPEELLIIGDSMQENGPDLTMVMAAPGALGMQVGNFVPPSNIHHVRIEPAIDGTLMILSELLAKTEAPS